MKTSMILLAFACCFCCHAQPTYSIGDKLPDLQFLHLINTKSTTISLHQLNNQLVLLEFWSSRCTACVASMVKLSALQEKFKDRLQVILVTVDSHTMVQEFFRKKPHLKQLGLPVSCNDQKLKNVFPHKAVPHVIWINHKKEIVAITASDQVTEQNIQQLLNGNQLKLPLKWEYMEYTPDSPLFSTLAIQEKQVKFSTLLTGPVPEIPSGIALVKNENRRKVVARNATLRSMLAFTYRQSLSIPFFEYKQRITSNLDSLMQQEFCFEVVVPPNYSEQELLQTMRRNLEHILNFTSIIEKQKLQCYIIRPSDSSSHQSKSTHSEIRETEEYIELINSTVKNATGYINLYSKSGKLVIYEGNPSNTITMAIQKSNGNPETLFPILKAHGYAITIEERDIESIKMIFQ